MDKFHKFHHSIFPYYLAKYLLRCIQVLFILNAINLISILFSVYSLFIMYFIFSHLVVVFNLFKAINKIQLLGNTSVNYEYRCDSLRWETTYKNIYLIWVTQCRNYLYRGGEGVWWGRSLTCCKEPIYKKLINVFLSFSCRSLSL